jgi:hypothetical protein
MSIARVVIGSWNGPMPQAKKIELPGSSRTSAQRFSGVG